MRYAHIIDGLVVGIFATAQPDIDVVDAPDYVSIGWTYKAGVWAQPAPTLAERYSAVWAQFDLNADALAARMLRARMFDGPNLAAAEISIKAEYATLIAKRDAALEEIEPE